MHTIHLGKSIQAAQKIHGISNATVARELGISRQLFNHLRRQKDIYTSRTVALCQIFDMELMEFIELGEDEVPVIRIEFGEDNG